MRRRLIAIVLCILFLSGCGDEDEKIAKTAASYDTVATQKAFTPKKYKCAKGHIAEAFFVNISWTGGGAGLNVAEIQTCPVCLKEWCKTHMPKVMEVK